MRFLILILLLFPARSLSAVPSVAYRHYLQGVLHEKEGQPQKALEEYREASKLDPSSPFLQLQMAGLELQMGHADEAMKSAEKAVELDPENAKNHYLLGQIYWAKGEPGLAEKSFQKTLQLDPEWTEVRLALCQIYASENSDKAEACLKKYLETAHQSPEIYYQMALLCYKKGDHEGARKHLKTVLDLEPGFTSAHYILAQIEDADKNWKAADAEYQKILEQDPDNTEVLTTLGDLRHRHGDLQGAERSLKQALQVEPGHPAAALYLMIMAEEQKDWNQALDYLSRNQAFSKEPQLWIRKSYYQIQSGDLPGAVQTLKTAGEKWPQDAEIAYFLSLGYDDLGQTRKAIPLLENALELKPDYREARFQLAVLYEKTNQMDKAEREFQALLSQKPDDAVSLNYLGYSLADRGLQLDRAQSYIQKAVHLDPGNGAYGDSLGWVYFKQGKSSQALVEIQKAAEILPQDPTIWQHLGEITLSLHDADSAWAALKKSQLLDPKNKQTQQLINKVQQNFQPDVLGKKILFHFQNRHRDIKRLTAFAEIRGKIFHHPIRLQAILEYKAPSGLHLQLLGPMLWPIGSMEIGEKDAFRMTDMELIGISSQELSRNAQSLLQSLRDYWNGDLFKPDSGPVTYQEGWWKNKVTSPQKSFSLDSGNRFIQGCSLGNPYGLRMNLDRFLFIKQMWIPSRIRFQNPGFQLEFSLKNIAAE